MSRFTTASRRQFLLGGAALGATGFLAACGGGNGGTGAGPTDGGGNEPSGWDWPAYQAFTGPQPDLPGTQDGVNAGFLAYPALADLVDTVGEAPGDGQPVTAMTPNYNRQPLDMDRNPFWQGLNERLGSVLDVRMVPGADYSNVFATTVASGEMPDLFTLYASPRLPEFLQSQALDLTDHLAGDAILAYPNLAAIPTSAWQYSVFGGRIYTIPLFRGLRTSWALIQRSDLMEQMGLNPEPQSFEELLEVAKEFTDPSQNRWAFSDFPADFLRQTLGIPNGWGLEGDTITSALTDERQMDFFEAGLRLMEAGVVHPEAFDDSGRKSRLVGGSGAVRAGRPRRLERVLLHGDEQLPGDRRDVRHRRHQDVRLRRRLHRSPVARGRRARAVRRRRERGVAHRGRAGRRELAGRADRVDREAVPDLRRRG